MLIPSELAIMFTTKEHEKKNCRNKGDESIQERIWTTTRDHQIRDSEISECLCGLYVIEFGTCS